MKSDNSCYGMESQANLIHNAPQKTSGFYGMTTLFYNKIWNIVKNDLGG